MAWRARAASMAWRARARASRYGARALAATPSREFAGGVHRAAPRAGGTRGRAAGSPRAPAGQQWIFLVWALARAVGPGLFAEFVGRHGRRLVLARCAAYLACARLWGSAFVDVSGRRDELALVRVREADAGGAAGVLRRRWERGMRRGAGGGGLAMRARPPHAGRRKLDPCGWPARPWASPAIPTEHLRGFRSIMTSRPKQRAEHTGK